MRRYSWILLTVILGSGTAFAQLTFTDVTNLAPQFEGYASTVAWGDVDNDGLPDLFIGGGQGSASVLYWNKTGEFHDVTFDYGLTNLRDIVTAQFIDFNNDGLLDLVCTASVNPTLRVFRQTTEHRFQPVGINTNFDLDFPIRSVTWSDLNGDGSPDMLVSNSETANGPSIAFELEGAQFVAERGDFGEQDLNSVGAMIVADYDCDGRPDILMGNNSSVGPNGTTHLWHKNADGTYTDMRSVAYLPTNVGATGAVCADFNNDQRPDFFFPGEIAQTRLMYSCIERGEYRFKDYTDIPGIIPEASRCTTAYPVDINMDGWMDLFVPRSANAGNSVLLNQQGTSFVNISHTCGLWLRGNANLASAWADMDGDGDPDVAIAEGAGGIKLFRNNVSISHEYITLKLADLNNMTPLLDCKVYAEFTYGKQIGTTSLCSYTPGFDGKTLTIVNPANQKSENLYVHIWWPNGETSDYHSEQIPLNETSVLHQPALRNNQPDVTAVEPAHDTPVTLTNSPNPFNPSTSISFSIPEAGHVNLSIFNLLGQQVALVASREYPAGAHSVNFDASALPSGLYFARISALGQTRIQRMLLAK